jgi:hypothetical protein
MTKSTGQFSSIAHYLVNFTQVDLHRLASDSIDSDVLFDSNSQNLMVSDVLSAICRVTIDLLIDACKRTKNLLRIRILVDHITFSWEDKNGDIFRTRNNKKLEDCLNIAVSTGVTRFVLRAHCDTIYFASDFNGLDLDRADTKPFPVPVLAPSAPPSVAPSSTTAPSTAAAPALASVPPTDIFNYCALLAQVRQRYNDYQDANKVLRAQDMTKYFWPDGSSQYYYTDPSIIGSRSSFAMVPFWNPT